MTNTIMPSAFALLDHATAQVTYADSLSELVDQLVDGHAESDDDGKLALRADTLAVLAGRAQAVILGDAGDAVADLGEDALTVLLHDRRADVPEFTVWESDLPLFLMATSYAPFSEVAAPEGTSIVWVNPHTERSFLESLASVGVAELMVRQVEAPED